MRALLLTESSWPNIGGVERHIKEIVPLLESASIEIEIVSKRNLFGDKKNIKFLTLLQIWWKLLGKIQSIRNAHTILIHDVFIYYLPFALIFPRKKIITTFHGHEKIYPIPLKNILYKKLAQKFSTYTISIGSYINKHYSLSNKNNFISYGAVNISDTNNNKIQKVKNSFLFVGRLENDTGLSIFLEFLDILKQNNINFSVKFCGEGKMRSTCLLYGEVLGFVDPNKYLVKSENCFAGGYLSILEAMVNHNYVLTAYENPLKKDYLLNSPFRNQIATGNSAKQLYLSKQEIHTRPRLLQENFNLAKKHSYSELAKLYLKLINT